MSFEPIILGFCCNECAYAAADLAGMLRINYPFNIRIIRVPCSGQVDLIYLLRAIDLGADGVFVAGCRKGECHYIDGNLKAEKIINFFKKILDAVGLSSERAEIFFVAASEAEVFVKDVLSFTDKVKSIGPNPHKRGIKELEIVKKRAALSMFIRKLAESLGKPIDELPVLTEVPEIYSELSINSEKCTGCKACELACDYEAIKFRDGRERALLYSSSECTICKKCFQACPEEAISIENSLDLASLASGEFVTKVKLPLVMCASCGNVYITKRVREVFIQQTPLIDLIDLCPECRRREMANRLVRLVLY